MTGICKGYTSGALKVSSRLDKGWSDSHGRDKVPDIRRKLRKRLLERNNSGVVDWGRDGAVAVDEKNSLNKFVKKKVDDPAEEMIVKMKVLKELKKFEKVVDRELEAQLVESLWGYGRWSFRLSNL